MKHLLAEFQRLPWAVLPETYASMVHVLTRWASGVKLSDEEIRAAIGSAPEAAAEKRNIKGPRNVGVLPLIGIMSQRGGIDMETSEPLVSADRLKASFRALMNDDSVGAIVLNIDSPGGNVFGIEELAAEIYGARDEGKKIVAVANSMAASAAYWVASAAHEVVVTPSGVAGSIGAMSSHMDISGALENEGVNVTLVTSSKYKAEGNPFGPLDEEAQAEMQRTVNHYGGLFTAAVARHRGVSLNAVRNGFGQGRLLMAKQSVDEGLADRVETLDQTFARLTASKRAQTPTRRRAARAQLDLTKLG